MSPARRRESDPPTLEGEIHLGNPVTEREIEVLEWAAKGDTAAQTGERLFIEESTVVTHRRSCMAKLGARSLPQAVAYAIGVGYINIDTIMDDRDDGNSRS